MGAMFWCWVVLLLPRAVARLHVVACARTLMVRDRRCDAPTATLYRALYFLTRVGGGEMCARLA